MYAKVFSQIFDSSIADDYELRHFFMDLLVLADSDGVVDMTPTAIAGRTRMPIEKVTEFLKRLEGPDPESRTPDDEGRRIVRLDDHRTWGWLILNYDTFRKIATEEQRKEGGRRRQQRRRAKIREKANDSTDVTPLSRPVTPCHANVTAPSAYAYASSSASVGKGGVGENSGELDPEFVLVLLSTYRRPSDSRLNYGEQSALAEIIRERPRYRDEWDTILGLRRKEPRYFPQSLSKLLAAWQETLDRAMNWAPPPSKQPTIADRLMKELNSIK